MKKRIQIQILEGISFLAKGTKFVNNYQPQPQKYFSVNEGRVHYCRECKLPYPEGLMDKAGVVLALDL